jgi:hypothetical protein
MPAHRPREYHFWSPTIGDWTARLSVSGKDGREYWRIVARPASGGAWRDARRESAEALFAALDAGLEPGEVLFDEETSYPSR